MNQKSCDQEQRVLAAVRSGVWEIELRNHVKDCTVCADVLVVAEFLQQEDAVAKAELALPSAGFLWWKSQLLVRQRIVKQAIRPITLAKNLAYLICSVTLLWLAFASAQTREWIANVFKDGAFFQDLGTGDFRAVGFLAVGGSILCALLGSLYILWDEK